MLHAKVVRIESGSKFTDGGQRVTLRFEAADMMFAEVTFPAATLGIVGLSLDDVVNVQVAPVRPVISGTIETVEQARAVGLKVEGDSGYYPGPHGTRRP